jgi:hypothetical protein
MVSSRDTHIVQRQASPHTRGCYRRDAGRLLAHAPKPLSGLTLGDLQSFAQSLVQAGPMASANQARGVLLKEILMLLRASEYRTVVSRECRLTT